VAGSETYLATGQASQVLTTLALDLSHCS
jgi:hypothetical protein